MQQVVKTVQRDDLAVICGSVEELNSCLKAVEELRAENREGQELQQLPAAAFSAAEVRELLRLLHQRRSKNIQTVQHLAAAFLSSVQAAKPSCCTEVMIAIAALPSSIKTAKNKEAFAAAASRLLQQLPSLRPKDLALSLYSSSKFGDTAALQRFAAAAAPHVSRLAPLMNSMLLSLTANALAAAAQRHHGAFAAIEAAALQQRDRWKPQDAALLVNAYTRLEIYSHNLFAAAAQHVRRDTAAAAQRHIHTLIQTVSFFSSFCL